MALKKKQPVMLQMTGEEFKKLIEQHDPNGIVNTLSEVLAMFEGIGDDETIAEYVRRMASAPQSVGNEQMKDGAVSMDKLADDVREQLVSVDDIMTIGEDAAKSIVAAAITKAEEAAKAP